MADITGMLQAAAGAGGGGGAQPSNITFIGSSIISRSGATGTTNWSLTELRTDPSGILGPVTLLEDDLVIILLVVGGSTTGGVSVTTSGYTTLADLSASSTEPVTARVSYKFMGATPDTTVYFTNSGSSLNAQSGVILVYRNVDTSDPFPSIETATFTNTVLPTPPAITPESGAFHILVGGGGSHDTGNRPYTNTEYESFDTTSANDTNDCIVGMGASEWTGGTFTPNRFTWGGSDSSEFSSVAFTAMMKST
jgi:hypothetical protein